jgi:hypothetical protein
MDELTKEIKGEIMWCMLFGYDIVLVDESVDTPPQTSLSALVINLI